MDTKSIAEIYKGKEIHRRTREHMFDVKKRVIKAYQKKLAETARAKDH
ncbi:hypothetical protein MD588_25275 [Photobacterium sp. SDRW27]|nr:hypothetical protein [Photobacterium obscurum]MCW8332108.1 hypothetical protein [Photobacterium obscurum]